MTVRREEIFVEFLGRSLNQYLRAKGWVYYKSDKKACSAACAYAGVRRITPFVKPVQLAFFPRLRPARRNYDVTNYIGTTKMIEDSFVQLGLLAQDDDSWVRGVYLGVPAPASDGIEGFMVVIEETERASPGYQAGFEFPDEVAF